MSDNRTFIFQRIKRHNPEDMQARAFKIAELFEEFGLGVGKVFNPKLPSTTMTFEKDGVKIVFTISGLNDNSVLLVSTRYDKTSFKIGMDLDFDKFKEKLLEMYRHEHTCALQDLAYKNGRDAVQNAIDPYLKQITMTASKFGYESRVTVDENYFTIALSERQGGVPYRAKLRFGAHLQFQWVSIEPTTEHIQGFDYGYYDQQVAQMKNVEAFQVEISKLLTEQPVKHGEEIVNDEVIA